MAACVHAQEPVRYLQIVQQDDTPLPKWFLIDAVNRVPVGPAAGVFTFDVFTNVFPGWDVSLENPSRATWMRALAHTAIPKPVPAFLADEFPELRDLYGYVTGEVLYDNALQNIARAVEDAGGDLAHSVRVAGEKEPTHKGKVERAIQTVQGYIKEIPSLTLPIAQMRRFGYDPRKHVVVTVDQFRTMLDEAIQTYHTQPSDALGGRSPLQVWLEQVAIHGHHQPKDLDQFLRSIAVQRARPAARDEADCPRTRRDRDPGRRSAFGRLLRSHPVHPDGAHRMGPEARGDRPARIRTPPAHRPAPRGRGTGLADLRSGSVAQ